MQTYYNIHTHSNFEFDIMVLRNEFISNTAQDFISQRTRKTL